MHPCYPKKYFCRYRYRDGLVVAGVFWEWELDERIRTWITNPRIVHYRVKYLGRSL